MIRTCDVGRCAQRDLVASPAPVHLAAVARARARLLAGMGPLRERDRAFVETGLGRENAVVDLPPEARRRGFDAQRLERLLALCFQIGVKYLDRPQSVVAV